MVLIIIATAEHFVRINEMTYIKKAAPGEWLEMVAVRIMVVIRVGATLFVIAGPQ